jgi:hypothetical protein
MSMQAGNPNWVRGHKCSHYGIKANWPVGCNNGYQGYDKDTQFYKVFRCYSGGNRSRSLLWLCHNKPTSQEAHWACAIANAKKRSPYFAYSQKEVVEFYNGSSADAALQFFSTFCESEA